MNARLYDPITSLSLSPDNYVADADATQAYNRYSYCLNNPMKYVDPDGQWVHLVVGAVIGGIANWVAHGAEFTWKGLGYFGVGAAAGALSAGIGAGVNVAIAGGGFGAGFMGTATGVASTGFVAGAATGASAGLTNGFLTGTGNGILGGQNLGQALLGGLDVGWKQCLIGGITGGIFGGIKSTSSGRDFWTGDIKQHKISEVLYVSSDVGVQGSEQDVYTIANTDTKSVFYKPEDGNYGLRNEIKPGWYINSKVDGIATSKYADMIYKLPDGTVAKVLPGGEVSIINAPLHGWQGLNPTNSPAPFGWKSTSYFSTLDNLFGGNRLEQWQLLFNLARQIR